MEEIKQINYLFLTKEVFNKYDTIVFLILQVWQAIHHLYNVIRNSNTELQSPHIWLLVDVKVDLFFRGHLQKFLSPTR